VFFWKILGSFADLIGKTVHILTGFPETVELFSQKFLDIPPIFLPCMGDQLSYSGGSGQLLLNSGD